MEEKYKKILLNKSLMRFVELDVDLLLFLIKGGSFYSSYLEENPKYKEGLFEIEYEKLELSKIIKLMSRINLWRKPNERLDEVIKLFKCEIYKKNKKELKIVIDILLLYIDQIKDESVLNEILLECPNIKNTLINKKTNKEIEKMISCEEKVLNGDLRELNKCSIAFIKERYDEISKEIVDGAKIGKQSLKYFAVKNKEKLDNVMKQIILKKYPRMARSIGIKDYIYNGSISKEPFKLNKLLFKKGEYTEAEIHFLKSKIDYILKRKTNNNYNKEIKKMIESYFR